MGRGLYVVFVSSDQHHEVMAQLFFSYGVCLRPNRFIVAPKRGQIPLKKRGQICVSENKKDRNDVFQDKMT